MTPRKIPAALTQLWSRLPAEPPLEALASSHALHRALAGWQTALVKEALAAGASWEDIGAALGSTKQGAWARFRVALGDHEGEKSMQDRNDMKRRASEVFQAGRRRIRDLDSSWRKEQETLRDEIKASKDRLAEAKHRHAQARRQMQHDLRRELAALRE